VAVREVSVLSREPFAGGASFDACGAFELIRARVGFALDPRAQGSRGICDLERAPTDGDGRVHFEADALVLLPAEAERSRRLLFVVPNRGMAGGLPFSLGTGLVQSPLAVAPGDAFPLRRGWSVAWCGWQWDVPARPGLLGLRAPQALAAGAPLAGRTRVAFRLDAPSPDRRLGDAIPLLVAFAPYSAADLEERDASLCVRDWPEGPPRPIARSRWRFARDVSGRPEPDADHVWLEGGFEPHRYYELIYTTRHCPVAGLGLAAVRDFVSFLRHGSSDAGNPCAAGIERTMAYGISQSGRFLRHFLYEAMNLDESGRPVFDGVIAHIAGARRGEFNCRFAQPSLTWPEGFGNLPPWGDALFERQRQSGGMPRVILSNSAFEYWRGDAALAHVDPATGKDAPEADDVRLYAYAGADHIGDVLLFKDRMPLANPPNPLDLTLATRALFANLERWICEGVEPPPSEVPRVSAGTATDRESVLGALGAIPGLRLPSPDARPATRVLELGAGEAHGVASWPIGVRGAVPAWVSRVDADGNEIAGVRLPEQAVPLGTYCGWNPRAPQPGLPDVLYEFAGSLVPFAADERQRESRGDPRPSLAARYRDRDDYAARVRRAALELASARLLLDTDVEAAVASALSRYDSLKKEQAMTQKPSEPRPVTAGLDLSLVRDAHVKRYRETDGAVGYLWNGAPCLVLTTRRKNGAPRDSALIFGTDGPNYLLIASKGGAPEHPWWYRDLVANPSVEIQVKAEKIPARARTARPDEKSRLWSIMTRTWPSYDAYQKRTTREIPLVVLEPTRRA
jgi:deazaflavin-dependent oxidoreductase (nitroreductase family)